ncbi:M1 family metallopeptidase [Lacinutrix sp. C3R15]|uniref:M1 family metallopeptidase n=1 Tax=Flavobacteriaceae TaxID=49546 RepID=UPI001C096656|nr:MULTISPECIES: M1 family metallopeptidase [Flavobacteriaceae]MBU2938778.1 M1 family metallopeptidase [Lacinutrix sp. C3R15]MDO6622091.1 M1 family metallopeptidase [Oceanihabitans sp. 1_MG-2023]
MKIIYLFLFTFLCVAAKAQQTDIVDFKRLDAVVFFNQIRIDSTVYDSFEITFDILKKTDSIYLDAVNMKFKNVSLNGKEVTYKNDGDKLIIFNTFKPSQDNKLQFLFFASPKKAMYFVGWENEARNQIWTQGQGKYTSNWLPSIDDMNDKIEFDLTFAAPTDYEVISNGKLVLKNKTEAYTLWKYDMQKPMASYLAAVVVGKYDEKIEVSKSGIPLKMYYYPEDSLKVAPTYKYTKTMFDFLEEEIGVSYSWQNYKQVPVHDFLYAGMENTSCTIFSDAFMIDETAFVDKNYVNVNAHELAHQWFGDLVTETSGTHHWLQEGFATYYALLAEKHVFGDDYYYWRLYEYIEELAAQDRVGESTALMNAKASSTTFYKKGAVVLHMLHEKVGDVAFKEAVKNYLKKYAFKNVETSNFIKEVEQASNQDLSDFVAKWLLDKTFYYEEVLASLQQRSAFITEYLMVDCEAANAKCDYYLTASISDQAKSKIISQVPDKITREVFKNSIKVRQAIAQNMSTIPFALKQDYESLLEDKSYLTVEAALYNLWVNFLEDRSLYLDKTKDSIGLPDKNVRLLWLTLALATPDYAVNQKKGYLNELIAFTSPVFNFEIRMQAFTFLDSLGIINQEIVNHYKEAEQHHNWRLKKFARAFFERNKENLKTTN